MNVGVLTVKNFDFHPNMRLKQACESLGHQLTLINPYNLVSGIKNQSFLYDLGNDAQKLNIVLPRQGSPMGDYGLAILRQFEHLKIPLVNGLDGVTIARNQYLTLQALASKNILVPDTFFVTKIDNIQKAAKNLGGFPVIVKQVGGMGGEGVIKLENESQINSVCQPLFKDKKGIIVQQFIPPEERTDLRIIVIGEKAVAAMRLEPRKGDFRTNINLNGHAKNVTLAKELERLAVKSAKACRLEIAGIDLIIPPQRPAFVIEVNYSPGFKGIEAVTGLDIAGKIMDYITLNYQ